MLLRAPNIFMVLYFFLDADYFFLEVVFFLAKKIICTKTYSALKKHSALKQILRHFFLRTVFFFLAQMPHILEVVKKVLWAIP